MKTQEKSVATCLLLMLCFSALPLMAAPKTNIILIMADDIGYECFGFAGSNQYSTPRLDQLVAEGMSFTHCYSQPLCTPSRVKLMTGLSNVRNYAAFSVLRQDQKTIGQYFQENGYRTCIAGKWQLYGAEHYAERFRGKGTMPEDAGFDSMCLWQVDKLGGRFWNPLLYVDGENKQFGATEYGPDIVTKHITNFIEDNHSKPFFVYYPMILTHSPFVPTPNSADRMSKDKQKNFEDMTTYMDMLVGRIVDKTREVGIAENTLILFVGDNGTHVTIRSRLNGKEIRGGKGKMTDAGTRVPFVAYQPGTVDAGQINSNLIDFSDFLPTTLEAVGVTAPPDIDGQSFLWQLCGKTGEPRKWIHIFYHPRPEKGMSLAFVRTQRYKLYRDGRFYDVLSDVNEESPLGSSGLSRQAMNAHTLLTEALTTMPAYGRMLLKYGNRK
ncbi:MAG: sulfatase-like hydrolase/transferase [Planctomycetota bacterium]|nr:sulfatase-like hydrolase/transferase [Planctomycetota bacterium]